MELHDRIIAFKELMNNTLTPEDTDYLSKALMCMGFFTAPASTRFHGDYEGGLFNHSHTVTKELLDLTDKLCLQWQDPRSPYIVGMFHDLCKCDAYIVSAQGIEYNRNMALNGHGDKSAILAGKLIAGTKESFAYLTDEEIYCIRWHMGAYDDRENWAALNRAIKEYPNVLYTHTADMIASQIKGC